MKILIVEDDENSRVLLESALEASGYKVESAENGEVALAIAYRTPPDLIISDILMPEMDGYALCKAVKEHERLCAIPFIFYTATYTDPYDEKLAMDMGASRFIVKPMEIDAFLVVIKNVLENYRTEKIPVAEQPLKNEQKLQQGYTTVLAKKLDQKVRQLEKERKILANSEKKYRRLVEALRDDYFFYTHDTNGVYTYISPSIKNVLGYTQEEFLVHYSEYQTGSDINKDVERYTDLCIKGKKQPPYEVEVYHKNGSVHRLAVTEEPVLDKHGQVTAVEGIAHDITKRILAEKQLVKAQEKLQQSQKMEAIGTLAGGIAHDFNNILGIIIGYTELTMDEVTKETAIQENLQAIYKAGMRAADLIKQILTFSRQTDQELEPIGVKPIVKEVLKLCRSTIPSTIEIHQDIGNKCGLVMAYSTQIHQIVINLITNAYHAMQETGGKLSVILKEVELSPEDIRNPKMIAGPYVYLAVEDTGHGIDKAVLDKIFEPYFTTKEKGKGTGLGLSVVHGIVKSYGGDISVYSEVGKGTSFYVYLPVIKAETGDLKPKVVMANQKGNERILFVDDEEAIVNLLRLSLKRLGYKVMTRNSSTEALEDFRADPNKFDIVITDMTMPNMTGVQLSREMLLIRPDIPIILCTGFSENIDTKRANAMGIKGFLMKPVVTSELAKKFREMLDDQ